MKIENVQDPVARFAPRLDLSAVMAEVEKVVIEHGFVSADTFAKYVTLETDPDRVEGVCGYPAIAMIVGELGPDGSDSYWMDYAWPVLQDKFPGYGFGCVNNGVLSIYKEA